MAVRGLGGDHGPIVGRTGEQHHKVLTTVIAAGANRIGVGHVGFDLGCPTNC